MIPVIIILIIASGPFAILDVPVFDGNWSTLDHHGQPDTTHTVNGRLSGYVDVTGFTNVSIINGTAYIQNDTAPVYSYQVSSCGMGFNDNVDSIESNTTIVYINNTVHVSVSTVMGWHHSTMRTGRTRNGGSYRYITKDYYTSTATFTDTADMHDRYNGPEPQQISITQYVNATCPHSFIIIPELQKEVTEFVVEYNGSSITKYVSYGVIEPNLKGIEQVNYSKIEQWKTDGDLCSHRAGMIVIDEAPLNLSNLNVLMKHPYGEVNCTEFIIQNVTTGPDKIFKENGQPVAAVLCIPVLILLASLWMLRRAV